MFLKRCEPPEAVTLKDFYVGATVTLFSRQFRITGFGDVATERRLKLARSSTLGVITSDALASAGRIISAIQSSGLSVGRLAMLALSADQATAIVASRTPAGTCVGSMPWPLLARHECVFAWCCCDSVASLARRGAFAVIHV